MDCRDVERSIQAYWDRDPPSEQADRIRAHLVQCAVCRAEFGRLDEFLSRSEPVVVPAGLRDRVLGAVFDAVASNQNQPAGSIERSTLPAMGREQRSTRNRTFIPYASAGALAACIALVLLNRPDGKNLVHVPPPQVHELTTAPDPIAISSLFAVVLQPNRLAAAAAAAAQAAAIRQVTGATAEVPLPLRTDRRPLRQDWAPEAGRDLQQLPAVITAFSTLGA